MKGSAKMGKASIGGKISIRGKIGKAGKIGTRGKISIRGKIGTRRKIGTMRKISIGGDQYGGKIMIILKGETEYILIFPRDMRMSI